MTTDINDPREQSAAKLVSGILGDLQQLVEEQFQLTRQEIEEEAWKYADAAAVLALGIAFFFLDAIELCMAVAHLMHWIASPPGADSAWLPLWACHAVIAAVLVVIGGILTLVGCARFRSIQRSPNPVTSIFEEHVP